MIVRGGLAFAGVSSNIVSFPAHRRSAIPVGNAQEAAQRFLDVPKPGATAQDLRPILLFDLNGTLTSHTAARRSAGVNLMRPGVHHLTQLQVRSIHSDNACQCGMYCRGWPVHTDACRSAGVNLMRPKLQHHDMQLQEGPINCVQRLSAYSSLFKVSLQPTARHKQHALLGPGMAC